jgi:hypothetical protein
MTDSVSASPPLLIAERSKTRPLFSRASRDAGCDCSDAVQDDEVNRLDAAADDDNGANADDENDSARDCITRSKNFTDF